MAFMKMKAFPFAAALDYDGLVRMNLLYVGDGKMPVGVYGAVGNPAVPAEHQRSCFTGTGRILFGYTGLSVFLR